MRPRGRGRSGRRRILPALIALLACAAPAARAQSTTLAITSGAITAATPTITDYTNGYVCAGSVTWTATPIGKKRSDTVFVRLTTSVPMPATVGGAKALADFEYNTSASGCAATTGWSPVPLLTATPAPVGGIFNSNAIFRGTTWFRLRLDWTKDLGGATYTLPAVDFLLNHP